MMRQRKGWNSFGKLMRSYPAAMAMIVSVLGSGTIQAKTPPSSPRPTAQPSAKPAPSPEPKVLISEVVVKGAEGKLQEEVYKAVKTRAGEPSTRSQLQKDINAVFATGFFSNVKATPEDTPLGVRVTFEVQQNPVLRSVFLKGATLLSKTILEKFFQPQYGKVTNYRNLQAGIQNINKWYSDQGYVLAQVRNEPQVAPDGTVTLEVAEGVIEAIQVRYLDKDGKDQDAKGNSIQGKTPASEVLRPVRLKPGDVFNRSQIEKDLKQIYSEGFEDAKLSLNVGKNPRQVIVVVSVTNNDEVERAINLGRRAETENTDEARRRALTHYQTALKLAKARRDLLAEAFTVNRIAKVYYDLKEYSQTLDFFQQSLNLSKQLKLPILEATTLTNIANTYYNLEEFQQAFDLYNQSIPIWQAAERSDQNLGGMISFAAGISSTRGRFTELYFIPERLHEKNSDKPGAKSIGKGIAFSRIGELYQLLGDYQQALYVLNEATQLWQNAQAREKEDNKAVLQFLEALNLASVASVYADLEDRQQATLYLDRSQKQITSLLPKITKGSEQSTANLVSFFAALPKAFVNLGGDQQTGLLQQRIDFLNQLFQAFGTSGQLAAVAIVNSFGDSYIELGQPQEALKIYQKSLQTGRSSKDSAFKALTIAGTYKSIGKAQVSLGNYQAAIAAYNQCLKLLETLDTPWKNGFERFSTLNLKGSAHFQLKQFSQSREMHYQALILAQRLKNASQVAEALLGLAEIDRAEGNLAQSQSHIETALTRLEDQPLKPENSLDQILRFHVSESGQLDTWRDRSTPSSIPKPSEFKFYKDLTSYFASKRNYYEFYIDLLMQRYRQTRNKQFEALALQASERFHARSLLAMLGRSDRTTDPRYVQLNQPPQLKEIQQQILDNDTMLLEYSLGAERSYLWAVTKTGISSYELPKRSVIEAAAQDFYDYLTVPSLRLKPTKTANSGLALSQLTIAPIAEKLGKKRLVIVGDGLLQYIPFNALPHPKSSVPLLNNYEIVSLPSASTLTLIRRDRANRPVPQKTLAVVADPVFDRTDDRFAAKLKENPQSQDLTQIYPRLPGTRTQVEEVFAFVPPEQRLEKFGFAADRQAVLDPEFSRYRILHFATHGILNSQRPERSGMILSVFNDRGEPQRSLLSPSDVFNLKLSADLVVLSGCRTGLGTGTKTEVKGEGLIGLTGSFLYAGSEQVIASLWSVDDVATNELMKRFYNGIFTKKLTPAAALRDAQRSLSQDPRWQAPYYWAGFILQGDWRNP